MSRPTPWRHLLILSLAGSPGLAAAIDCDALREQVQQRIRANGVADAVVAIEPTGPLPEGAQLLGRCELGARQLVWRRGSVAGAPAPAVLTECDDGHRVTPGRCAP